jgi:hypothetical protein
MRTTLPYFFVLVFCVGGFGQTTLIQSAPTDTFFLDAVGTEMQVLEVKLSREQRVNVDDIIKSAGVNLLQWKYYDDILKRDAYMNTAPYWTTGKQLLEDVSDVDLLALHLHLNWKDTLGFTHHFHLIVAGINKGLLSQLPLTAVFDTDHQAPLRFYAMVQLGVGGKEWETYECSDGTFTLDRLNTANSSMEGSFNFSANRLGMDKHGVFLNGYFVR